MSDAMISITCGECGISFGLPKRYQEGRAEDGKTFYCPNGHARAYTKSTTDKLREELSRAKQQTAMWQDMEAEASARAAAAERSAAATRGVVTKLKKRAANGVCPCCTRSFTDLRRHMETKHPAFVADDAREGATIQ